MKNTTKMEPEEIYNGFNDLFLHPYFLAVYGVIAYFTLKWSFAKNPYDDPEEKKKFSFKVWWGGQYDNLIVTIIFVPLVIIFDEEVVYLIKRIFDYEIQTNNFVYLLSGPVVDGIYLGLSEIKSRFRKK